MSEMRARVGESEDGRTCAVKTPGWRTTNALISAAVSKSGALPSLCALTDKPHRVAVKEFVATDMIEQDGQDAS